MVNEELVGGLKNALERGDSLKSAMMSFFNAGYDKKEIEEAAATLLNYPTAKPAPTPMKQPEQKNISPPKSMQKISQYGEEKIPTPKPIAPPQKQSYHQIQKVDLPPIKKFAPKEIPKVIVSALPQTTPKKKSQPSKEVQSSIMTTQEKAIIAILIGLLVFLVGLLVVIFLFRQQLIDFISSLVS